MTNVTATIATKGQKRRIQADTSARDTFDTRAIDVPRAGERALSFHVVPRARFSLDADND